MFVFLAQADGTGGIYYYYRVHEDKPLEEQPIVFFGSEGEINIVAKNLNDFLVLLTSDTEIMGDDEYDGKSIVEFELYEDSHTTYLSDYKKWLASHNLNAKLTKKERIALIKDATEMYGTTLFSYLAKFDKKRFD